MLTLLAAAVMVPPPVEGDDRTAILHTVRSTLDGLISGEDVRANFAPEAIFPVVDARGDEVTTDLRTLDEMLASDWTVASYREPFGIPTVFQDGALAQVWIPYSFWVDGTKIHCGIDNVTLLRRDEGWIITQFGFSMNGLETCEALGAPTVAEPE